MKPDVSEHVEMYVTGVKVDFYLLLILKLGLIFWNITVDGSK